jgi:hypothetical protein
VDRRSIAQLRTATDLVTRQLAADFSLSRTAIACESPPGSSTSGDMRPTDDLRARRQKLGWSVKDVSGRCGIDEDVLSEWERGAASPRLDAVQCWARALGLNVLLVPTESAAPRALKVDWDQRRITVAGTPVRLTPMEWKALDRLARVPGELVSHQALFHHLYGEERIYRAQSTAIRVLITKLRRLLPLRIEAKWGKGYLVSDLEASLPSAPANGEDRADDDGNGSAMSEPEAPSAPCTRVALTPNTAPREPAPTTIRRQIVELDESGMRRVVAPAVHRGPCRAEELGVIERFLAERGVTRCPDVATIEHSPLPTLVWDKTKRKWVRPSATAGEAH